MFFNILINNLGYSYYNMIMARKKLAEDKKKPKISITIDKNLDKILGTYLEDNKINRSKYIEHLIREDFEKKGFDVTPDF